MPLYQLPQVSTGTWSMSVMQPGVVLTDLDVWKQRCYIVLNTPLGSDPLRPLFGCDYHKYIDGVSVRSAARMKSEILDALTIWVPEVTVNKITYTLPSATMGTGLISFKISISIGKEHATLPFRAGASNFFGEIKGVKIINAGYKWYYTNLVPSLTVNGAAAVPSVPFVLPWTDIPGMMTWIRANWNQYGTWGIGKDELLLFMNPVYNDARLSLASA